MRIEHIIDNEIKVKLGYSDKGKGKVHSNNKKRNKRKSERLSERDLKELMGMNRDTYKRVNGKIKRK